MKEEYKNDEFLAALDAAGADVDGALNRFMGKVFLYEKFMKKFLDDRSYPDMLDCLAGHDLEEAFRQAHTLKGVAGNLGINNLLAVLVPMVEALRAGHEPSEEQVNACKVEYEKIVNIIKEYRSE
ncbi:MAG: Hpt domain-containing protein [Enterocloster asparagiformis]|nr:Hpt domain-containing protein [Enterocloster asparagiformis]